MDVNNLPAIGSRVEVIVRSGNPNERSVYIGTVSELTPYGFRIVGENGANPIERFYNNNNLTIDGLAHLQEVQFPLHMGGLTYTWKLVDNNVGGRKKKSRRKRSKRRKSRK